jgi:hypothetical protein
MIGFAYPELLVRLVRLYHSGEIEQAAEMFYTMPLIRLAPPP